MYSVAPPVTSRCEICSTTANVRTVRVKTEFSHRNALICRACCCACLRRSTSGIHSQALPEIVAGVGTGYLALCSECASSGEIAARAHHKRTASDAAIDSSSESVCPAHATLPYFDKDTPWSTVLDSIARVCEQSLFRLFCADVRHMIGRLAGTTNAPCEYAPIETFRSPGTVPEWLYPRAVAVGVVSQLCANLSCGDEWDNASAAYLLQLIEHVPHAQLCITKDERNALITRVIQRGRKAWPAVRVCPWRLLTRLWTQEVDDQLGKLKLLAPVITVDVEDLVRQCALSNEVFFFLASMLGCRGDICSFVTITFDALFDIVISHHLVMRRHPSALLTRWLLARSDSARMWPDFAGDIVVALYDASRNNLALFAPLLTALFDAILQSDAAVDLVISHERFLLDFSRLISYLGDSELGLHASRAVSSLVWSRVDVARYLATWAERSEWHGVGSQSTSPISQAHAVCLAAAFANSLGTEIAQFKITKYLLPWALRFLGGEHVDVCAWPLTEQHLNVLITTVASIVRLSGIDSLHLDPFHPGIEIPLSAFGSGPAKYNRLLFERVAKNVGSASPALFEVASTLL